MAVRRLALLLPVSALLLFFDFGSRVLATTSEARFPLLARDILAVGDWLLPRLNGTPYLNKPPLHAWLIALASWPTGSVTQRTAVLPSLLAALGVVAVTYWIARRLFAADVGLVAGLIVVTTYGMFTLARVPLPDMVLCLALTAAMAAFVTAEFDGRRAALVAFYVLVGVAFWAKGPPGLLALGPVILYTCATYGWSGPARLASTPGLLVLVLMLVPWWVLAAAAGRGTFIHDVVGADMLRWYLPIQGWRWRNLTEPVGQALTVLLPWSLVLPLALRSAVRTADPDQARRLRLLLAWVGAMFALFAVSEQQRMRYYLPLCPAAALLIAAWYSSLTLRRRTAAFACAWVMVAAGLGIWQEVAGARHNAATELRAIARVARRQPLPLYAFDAPGLVLEFYLDRAVVVLPDYRHFERSVHRGSVIIADRALPASREGAALRHVADGLVDGRRLSMLTKE